MAIRYNYAYFHFERPFKISLDTYSELKQRLTSDPSVSITPPRENNHFLTRRVLWIVAYAVAAYGIELFDTNGNFLILQVGLIGGAIVFARSVYESYRSQEIAEDQKSRYYEDLKNDIVESIDYNHFNELRRQR